MRSPNHHDTRSGFRHATRRSRARCFPRHRAIFSIVVKLPDVYRDWRIVAGLVLAFVGAGNWIVGLNRTRVASQMIAQAKSTSPSTDYRSFDEVDSTASVLQPFTEEE